MMDITNMSIDDIREQVEQQIDFDRLEELNAHLEKDIRSILDSCGLYYRIFSRVKTKSSISKKLYNGKYGTAENPKKVQDLIGLRIVLYYSDDLSIGREIMEKTFLRTGTWSRNDFNAAEFRATKINGVFRLPSDHFKLYTSELWDLPIDTTFEIQFRTVFFEVWHEIEHDMRYKSLLPDDKFWENSEDLSRILHCILANLELSDWSLVQLFEHLSYNHYQNGNWDLMLKSHFRLRMEDKEPLSPAITAFFDQDRRLAKQFFKCEKIVLVRELLKQDYIPKITFDLIIRLLNESVVHDDRITAYYQEHDPLAVKTPAPVRQALKPLDQSTLFHLEIPLLHKPVRELKTEFNNASHIIYRWIRYKLSYIFPDLPAEVETLHRHLPGYDVKCIWDAEQYIMEAEFSYIDDKMPGTLWHITASLHGDSTKDKEPLMFRHRTTLHTPTTALHRETFSKPSYLSELSSKIGLMDQERLGTQGRFVNTPEGFEALEHLLHDPHRRLPVIVITQHEAVSPENINDYREGYDMNTFPVNGTRLAKVIGLYSHVYMLDQKLTKNLSFEGQDTKVIHGGILIFWPVSSRREATVYTSRMIREAHFDYNRFAYHEQNFNEKAFRSKLAQIIKDDHVTH